MNSRQLVLRVITAFDKRPGNLERMMEHALHGLHIDHRDRRLVFEMVYGIVRHLATLDYMIDTYVTDENNRKDHLLRRLLRIGLYQLIYLDRVPDHASVNETVLLAKADYRGKGLAGTVNAVLRNVIKHKKQIELPDAKADFIRRLEVEFSHPRWLIDRWLATYGLARTRKLLAFNNEKPSIYLRRTIRGMSRQQFEADVRMLCDSASGYRDLYYRLKKALLPENIQLIKQGYCNIQAPSSGWVVAMLDVDKGEHIIDLCSAPGGKSVLMAELAGDSGTVCSCEVNYTRLLKVVETAQQMHLRSVYPLVADSNSPPFTGTFDKVLLDAPCSATGVLHRHPEARWIRTIKDLERLVKVQEALLDSSVRLVDEGGYIVYATCSVEPEENESQVERFLQRHPEFVLDHCPNSIPQQFIDDHGYLKITPFEHGQDGMFAARFRCITKPVRLEHAV